jgi:hypothetical protein
MRLLCALLCLAIATSARAWDAGGHEIVDAIACAHLNPKARAAVDQLAAQLQGGRAPYDAITLGRWMDDIRDDPSVPDDRKFRSWHYIDIPIDPRDPVPSFVPGTDTAVRGNAVQALKRALVVLEGGTDPYVCDPPTALALIEHLVGDIHQPLHCATKYFFSHGQLRDDKGGNDEFVLNGPPGNDKFNLHAFWDSAWRATFDEPTGNVVLDDRFHSSDRPDPAAIRDLASEVDRPVIVLDDKSATDFEAWARESNKVARVFVYPGITATDSAKYCRLGSAYVSEARARAYAQLQRAGHRLANLLNATLGAATPPPVPSAYPAGPADR